MAHDHRSVQNKVKELQTLSLEQIAELVLDLEIKLEKLDSILDDYKEFGYGS